MVFLTLFPGQNDDQGEEYWDSEHHRVEFSSLKPFLEQLDPNSLHQVAIAVPGNYVRKRELKDITSYEAIICNVNVLMQYRVIN